MTTIRDRQMPKELCDMYRNRYRTASIAWVAEGDDISHLKGVFTAPMDSPDEGGIIYQVDINIPDVYPPTVRFDTKIWHPNISSQTVSSSSSID